MTLPLLRSFILVIGIVGFYKQSAPPGLLGLPNRDHTINRYLRCCGAEIGI